MTASISSIIDCSGNPPEHFNGSDFTCRLGVKPKGDQLGNLYQGRQLDMRQIKAVQASRQLTDHVRLDDIERELAKHQFVGAHAVPWYQRPENLDAFLGVCPTGFLVLLEKYRDENLNLRVMCLHVHEGRVCVSVRSARVASKFDADYYFAVIVP